MAHTPVQILDGSGLFVYVDAQETTSGERQQTLTIGDGQNPGRVVNVQPDGALEVATNLTTNSALSNKTSSTTSQTFLTANTDRRGAIFFNDSTAALYLAYTSTAASATNFTVKVAAGGLFFMDVPIWTGAVTGVWAAANGFCRVTDLTA